jgi:hypothetical protein
MSNTEYSFQPIARLIYMSETVKNGYPWMVKVYMQRYGRMANPQYLRRFDRYAQTVLTDPIKGLDWKQLLSWEHRHLAYTRNELRTPRAEMPMGIIKQAEGRCGEFALLYNGLLLANAYQCRIVVDCSTLRDKSKSAAGDHVWNEVSVDDSWLHVDPTERRIDQPQMYAEQWNKDVNLVYAITAKEILNVTETYRAQT